MIRRVALLAILLALPTAAAHLVVVPGSGDSLGHATDLVTPPARVFDEIARPGGYHYYTMNLTAGQTITLDLNARADAFRPEYPPALLIAGPGVNDSGFRPSAISFPAGDGVEGFLAPAAPAGWSDARLPAAGHALVHVDFRANATGQHYFVVYSAEFGGGYSLWLGSPQGSPVTDRFEIPFLRWQAWSWNGVPLVTILGGALAGLAIGALGLWPARRRALADGHARAIAAAALVALASAGARAAAGAIERAPGGLGLGLSLGLVWEIGVAAAAIGILFVPAAGARRALCVLLSIAAWWLYAGWLVGSLLLVVAVVWPDEPPEGARA